MMYRKSPTGWLKHWDFTLLDEIAVSISFCLSYIIRLYDYNPFKTELYRTLFFVVLLSNLIVPMAFNTFSGVLKRGYSKLLIDTFRHVFLVLLINVFYTFLIHKGTEYSRIIVMLMAVFHFVLGYCFKIIYRTLRKPRKTEVRSFLLVTLSDWAEDAITNIVSDASGSITISGLAIVNEDMKGQEIRGYKVVANKDDVIEYATKEWIDEIYIRLPKSDHESDILFAKFMEMGITVHVDVGTVANYLEQKQIVENIGNAMVVTTSINTITGFKAFLKRTMDIVGGLVGSLFALLVMAIIAIPHRIASPGPLLYTSERIGLNGKRFKMYKIRSMYLDADARKKEFMAQNRVKDGMMFKLDWDPRIIGNKTLPDGTRKTGLGEFIRKTSLDEFPQFFNVLKGDMSLVGTRPPTPDEWEKYDIHHRARMATKPGITGMWQASGRSEITDFEEVVKLDTYYITNWSLSLDIKLLFKTVFAVFKGKGAM